MAGHSQQASTRTDSELERAPGSASKDSPVRAGLTRNKRLLLILAGGLALAACAATLVVVPERLARFRANLPAALFGTAPTYSSGDDGKVTGLSPIENPFYYYNLGVAANSQGDAQMALALYSHAIELDPNLSVAYYARGTLYSEILGDSEAALADLTRALELNPQDHQAYNNRAVVYNKQAEWESAISDLDSALAIGEFPVAYFNRGNAHVAMTHNEQAIADYTRAIEMNPQYYDAYFARGFVYQLDEKMEAAAIDYGLALGVGYTDLDAIATQAESMLRTRHPSEALMVYDALIRLYPDYAPAYYFRGEIFEELSADALAAQDYRRYLALADSTDEHVVYARFRVQQLGG